MIRLFIAIQALLLFQIALAQETLVVIPTRDSEKIAYWWIPRDNAAATVVLLTGGSGGMGLKDGRPHSGNFLVRSSGHFADDGFNVAIVGNPSDKRALDDSWRISGEHLTDIANIITDISTKSKAPVWIVGTSRGTISAAAAGINLQDQLAGVILTASVTSYKIKESVPRQTIEDIRIPVFVYHHRDDACNITSPSETSWIMRNLKNAPAKKLSIVTGGDNPTGDPCGAHHWHGFIGMERQAVREISEWIKEPKQ